MAEPGAVPAAVARNHGLGRRRTPTPGHYEPGARSLQPECAAWLPASAGRTPESTAVERRRACAFSKRKGAPWSQGRGSLKF